MNNLVYVPSSAKCSKSVLNTWENKRRFGQVSDNKPQLVGKINVAPKGGREELISGDCGVAATFTHNTHDNCANKDLHSV